MRLALASCFLSAIASAAEPVPGRLDNWHHWRGPLANGTGPNADPPINWDAKTNVKWTADLPGKSSATPIVWGDQVFVVAAVETMRQAKPDDLPKVDPKFERKTDPP